MSAGGLTDEEIICRILWRLARVHGWSRRIPVHNLVSQTNVPDERYARQLCETAVASKNYVGHDPVNGEIWLEVPHDDLAYDLRDCGYGEIRIEATLSHFDGF